MKMGSLSKIQLRKAKLLWIFTCYNKCNAESVIRKTSGYLQAILSKASNYCPTLPRLEKAYFVLSAATVLASTTNVAVPKGL